MHRYGSRQSQQPGQGQSKNAQCTSPLKRRGFGGEALTVYGSHSSVLAMYSAEEGSAYEFGEQRSQCQYPNGHGP